LQIFWKKTFQRPGPEPTFPAKLVKPNFSKKYPMSKETAMLFLSSFMNFKTIIYDFPQLQSFLRKKIVNVSVGVD
jgi:hypothetical protein